MSDSNSKHAKDHEHEKIDKKQQRHTDAIYLFNRKTIILILLIVFVSLVASFLIFRSPTANYSNEHQAIEEFTPINDIDSRHSNYKTINGAVISDNPSETNIPPKVYHERIEVPGYIADKLAQYEPKNISNDDKYNTNIAKQKINSQKDYVAQSTKNKPTAKRVATKEKNKKTLNFKELPLSKIIENNHYTIQLSGSSIKKNLLKHVIDHKLQNYQIYKANRKNNDAWFVIIKGNYPTFNDAKLALNSLPEELKADKPWIRSGKSIRNDKR